MEELQSLHRLELDKDRIGNDEVYSISAIQMLAFVPDGQVELSLKWKAAKRQLMGQTSLVGRL